MTIRNWSANEYSTTDIASNRKDSFVDGFPKSYAPKNGWTYELQILVHNENKLNTLMLLKHFDKSPGRKICANIWHKY